MAQRRRKGGREAAVVDGGGRRWVGRGGATRHVVPQAEGLAEEGGVLRCGRIPHPLAGAGDTRVADGGAHPGRYAGEHGQSGQGGPKSGAQGGCQSAVQRKMGLQRWADDVSSSHGEQHTWISRYMQSCVSAGRSSLLRGDAKKLRNLKHDSSRARVAAVIHARQWPCGHLLSL